MAEQQTAERRGADRRGAQPRGADRRGADRRGADRREEILAAAMVLADERGLDAVSMRAVAERVGVTPMALYPHVGSKAALLDGMMGRLLADLVPTAAPGLTWQDRLGSFARGARAIATRHPWAAALLFARPAVEPDSVRAVDGIYAALLDAGIAESDVPRLERMLSTFVLGFAASEAGGRFGPGGLDPRGRRGQLPDGTLPAHARLAEVLDRAVDWDAEFEADLADLESLVEAAVRSGQRERAAGTGEQS
jgi:AcrR family transcriptional regulator